MSEKQENKKIKNKFIEIFLAVSDRVNIFYVLLYSYLYIVVSLIVNLLVSGVQCLVSDGVRINFEGRTEGGRR